jgi:hypothetical protein
MTKRVFISIVLLLAYSLGFAHNFVPHNHDTETTIHDHEGKGHAHHHHHSKKQAHQDHEHISHGDHFDEGFYDLLICFLHTADNQAKDCDAHYYMTTDHNRTLTKEQNTKLLATLVVLYNEPEEVILHSEFYTLSELKIPPPLITNTPLRGPPTFS